MEVTQSARYRYALGANQQIIDIFSLSPETRRIQSPYTCLGCGEELIPNLGAKKVFHFSHRTHSRCSGETYLHKLAKQTFFDQYSTCLRNSTPFLITFPQNTICTQYKPLFEFECEGSHTQAFDLTSRFTKIYLEKKFNGFVPDILLASEDRQDVIFVEIAVTHHCEPEKIALGKRILELTVRDERSIEPILSHKIRLGAGTNVKSYNFRQRTLVGNLCNGDCQKPLGLFIVFQSKKCALLTRPPKMALDLMHSPAIRHYRYVGTLYHWNERAPIFVEEVRRSFFQGIALRNCFVCKYHGAPDDAEGVFCKYLKHHYQSNHAVSCSHFRPFKSMKEALDADAKNRDFMQKRYRRIKRSF